MRKHSYEAFCATSLLWSEVGLRQTAPQMSRKDCSESQEARLAAACCVESEIDVDSAMADASGAHSIQAMRTIRVRNERFFGNAAILGGCDVLVRFSIAFVVLRAFRVDANEEESPDFNIRLVFVLYFGCGEVELPV